MALPTLTVEQRDEALRKAQAARLARKQLLQAIAAGEQTIPAVLDRAKTDTVIGRTKVIDLHQEPPRIRPSQSHRAAGTDRNRLVPPRRWPGRAPTPRRLSTR